MVKPKVSFELLLVALLPILFLAFLGWRVYSTYAFIKVASLAQGHVVTLKEHKTIARGTVNVSYEPVIRFALPSGQPIEFVSHSKSGRELTLGSMTDVIYDPRQPDTPRLNNFSELWGPSVLLFQFAVFFIAFPLVAWNLYQWLEKKRRAVEFGD